MQEETVMQLENEVFFKRFPPVSSKLEADIRQASALSLAQSMLGIYQFIYSKK